MGEDGHFASLFPDSPELMTGLTGDTDVVSVHTLESLFKNEYDAPFYDKDQSTVFAGFWRNQESAAEEPAGSRHQSSAGSDAGRDFLGP